MPRLIISSVGTSILTNQIDPDFDPKNWLKRLQETTNDTTEDIEYHEDVKSIIDELKKRAEKQLLNNTDIESIRRVSAELNGIYGIYNNNLELAKKDSHILIATDTAQGKVAVEILNKFLRKQGLNQVNPYLPKGFSVASSDRFSEGMAKIITFLDETITSSKEYTITFNLVGGFKAFQGYLNTIGMFYADEMVYIFEGSQEAIIIPRLPVEVSQKEVEKHQVFLAMMAQKEVPSYWEEIKKIPKSWLFDVDKEVTLSVWGELIWNQCKRELLSAKKLLKFPNLICNDSFEKDYANINDTNEKIKLQETLAKVSLILKTDKGDLRKLSKFVEYFSYKGAKDKQGVDHFYVGIHFRVSCQSSGQKLILRHYGTHDYVEKKETK